MSMQRIVRPAFTIVELLVVIVVIAILAAITVVAYIGITNAARESSAKSEVKQAVEKLGVYRAQNFSYPSSYSNGLDSNLTYNPNSDFTSYCVSSEGTTGNFFVATPTNPVPSPGECAGSLMLPGSTTLAAPANSSAYRMCGYYNMTWDAVVGATGYAVQLSDNLDYSGSVNRQYVGTTNNGVGDGTFRLYIRVAAYNATARSPWVTVTQTGPEVCPP